MHEGRLWIVRHLAVGTKEEGEDCIYDRYLEKFEDLKVVGVEELVLGKLVGVKVSGGSKKGDICINLWRLVFVVLLNDLEW